MSGTGETLAHLLVSAARDRGAEEALVFPGHRLTYEQLLDRAKARARSLIAAGVKPGEHVGLLLPTCPEFIECLFGIALAGAVCVPINARYRADELRYVAENADLVAILTAGKAPETGDLDLAARLGEGLPGLARAADPWALDLAEAPSLRTVVVLTGAAAANLPDGAAFAAAGERVEDAALDERLAALSGEDIGLILYTSGTTSNPKGCLIHHGGIVGNSRALARRYRLTAADRFWSPLPIFHIAGILPMVAIMDVGGTYLAMRYFEPGAALEMLSAEEVTATYPCFVTIMQDMIAHPLFEKVDLSSIRLMNSSLAVQPPELKAKLEAALPHTVQVGTYGMSESAGTVCTNDIEDDHEARTTTLGHPLEGWEVRIVDPESGADCAPGERGEICVRGPYMLRGYYRDEAKTAEAIDADGWLHTGDLGSLDANGRIMFHGRLKDMLKVGGENVAAAEIEALLNRHPAVVLAQVVGVPDARYTEVPAAFVECRPGARVSEAELIDFCRGKIASFKIPRYIRQVESWPMSTSKIQKFKLRERLLAELEQQPA